MIQRDTLLNQFSYLLQIYFPDFDETHLAAYAMALFLDGTETSGAALSYAFYELAKNPHCQDKLYEEIVRTIAKYDGKITYEAIQEMNYLEGVVCETTRINPPALWTKKVCTKPYTLPKTSKQSEPITILPGFTVTIPILAIHMYVKNICENFLFFLLLHLIYIFFKKKTSFFRDPKYYPNPTEFQPERFSEEERNNRPKCTFLTFGEGHRVCLGMRFGIMQIKMALAHVILNFHIKLSQHHKPIVIEPKSTISFPKDGILLQFELRL